MASPSLHPQPEAERRFPASLPSFPSGNRSDQPHVVDVGGWWLGCEMRYFLSGADHSGQTRTGVRLITQLSRYQRALGTLAGVVRNPPAEPCCYARGCEKNPFRNTNNRLHVEGGWDVSNVRETLFTINPHSMDSTSRGALMREGRASNLISPSRLRFPHLRPNLLEANPFKSFSFLFSSFLQIW
ncbi:hypothetical protein IE53DRAFT_227991 [Violaceomyces palustris]|uniref:Uncharacterized protein n=1 Tax=Violaceomyces palustris TaxID=1673888 RepID=A0ACD0NPT3_9BASI|nr:hypothetical protein IE53DRAFT_227991 [Violaceomyces palustris]